MEDPISDTFQALINAASGVTGLEWGKDRAAMKNAALRLKVKLAVHQTTAAERLIDMLQRVGTVVEEYSKAASKQAVALVWATWALAVFALLQVVALVVTHFLPSR